MTSRKRSLLLLVGLIGAASSRPAAAEVKRSAPDGMISVHQVVVAARPDLVYGALVQVGKWWAPAHTWSGSAASLSLVPRAGGCFCETWPGGSAEHGRVVMARPNQLLRVRAALGPLQELALAGTLTWELAGEGTSTRMTVTYRVSGDSLHGLDKLAPAVDAVIGEQTARLKKFVETGSP
jgi:uncharacterized protein YndB with AHSA1/START domain